MPEPTTSPTADFFARMAGPQPLLKRVTGTVRVDLHDGDHVEHWYLTMADGEVAVSHRNLKADTVMRVDRSMFDDMVSGSLNATAALLRGDLTIDGDLGLVLVLQRCFAGPDGRPSVDGPKAGSVAS
jgi:predicted lipid carrier protein YhbT